MSALLMSSCLQCLIGAVVRRLRSVAEEIAFYLVHGHVRFDPLAVGRGSPYTSNAVVGLAPDVWRRSVYGFELCPGRIECAPVAEWRPGYPRACTRPVPRQLDPALPCRGRGEVVSRPALVGWEVSKRCEVGRQCQEVVVVCFEEAGV